MSTLNLSHCNGSDFTLDIAIGEVFSFIGFTEDRLKIAINDKRPHKGVLAGTKEEYRKIIKSDKHILGISSEALRKYDRLPKWLTTEFDRREWYDSEILFQYMQESSRAGEPFPLLPVIRRWPVVLVGPSYLKKLDPQVLKPDVFVRTPPRSKECRYIQKAVEEMAKAAEGWPNPVCFCLVVKTLDIYLSL
jgi:hypothetical protein